MTDSQHVAHQRTATEVASSYGDIYSSRYMFLHDTLKLAAYDMLRATLDSFVPLSIAHVPPLLIPPMYDGDPRRVRARELLILMEVLNDEDSGQSMLDILAGRFFTAGVTSPSEEDRVAMYGRMFLDHCKNAPVKDIVRIVYDDVFGGTEAGEALFRRLFYLDKEKQKKP